MYYVTMTDSFLSGWGGAENRVSKYVIECEKYDEVLTVVENAKHRSDMKNVRIAYKRPKYAAGKYHVSFVTKAEAPNWFKTDYFKTEK